MGACNSPKSRTETSGSSSCNSSKTEKHTMARASTSTSPTRPAGTVMSMSSSRRATTSSTPGARCRRTCRSSSQLVEGRRSPKAKACSCSSRSLIEATPAKPTRRMTTERSSSPGAVLLAPPRAFGFGFALKLGHDNLRGDDLDVSGYRVDSTPGQPETSAGRCIGCHADQLEYNVLTQQGLSGSPVFMPYKGHETAVAIHNNGPKRRGRGSRGTRLNETVLGEIFRWVGVGYAQKSLKVFNPQAPPEGLYLRFPPDQEYAWVRLGAAGLETSFDILPAYAPPTSADSTSPPPPLYVFRFRPPPGWPGDKKKKRWVLWDVVRQGVTLTDTLQDFCFPQIIPDKNPDMFRIVLDNKQGGPLGQLVELRMQATKITPQDIKLGAVDTPEVSFGKYLRGKKEKVGTWHARLLTLKAGRLTSVISSTIFVGNNGTLLCGCCLCLVLEYKS
ncbi:hypothetical protein VTN96DRAFT_1954 [Rasamsonia emersonii]